jgi:hypothetical protein
MISSIAPLALWDRNTERMDFVRYLSRYRRIRGSSCLGVLCFVDLVEVTVARTRIVFIDSWPYRAPFNSNTYHRRAPGWKDNKIHGSHFTLATGSSRSYFTWSRPPRFHKFLGRFYGTRSLADGTSRTVQSMILS